MALNTAGVVLFGLSHKGQEGLYTVAPFSIGRYGPSNLIVPEIGKGGIDAGESPMQGGFREFHEELGLDLLSKFYTPYFEQGKKGFAKGIDPNALGFFAVNNGEPFTYRAFGQEVGHITLYAAVLPTLDGLKGHLKGSDCIHYEASAGFEVRLSPDMVEHRLNKDRKKQKENPLPRQDEIIDFLLKNFAWSDADRAALLDVQNLKNNQYKSKALQELLAKHYTDRDFYNATKGWKLVTQATYPQELSDHSLLKPCGLTCNYFIEGAKIVPATAQLELVADFLTVPTAEERTRRHQLQWGGDKETQGLKEPLMIAIDEVLKRQEHYATLSEQSLKTVRRLTLEINGKEHGKS